MYYRSPAIILKNMDYQEQDKLVHVFTEKEGRINAIARGIKKPASSLRASVQPFCYSLLFFSSGPNLDLITQGRVLDFFGNCREDLQRTLYAVYIMELLDKSLLERMPISGLFATTVEVLQSLDQQGANPLIIRYMEIKLMIALGFKPALKNCIRCGEEVSRPVGFSLADGGIVCPRCAQDLPAVFSLSGEVLGLIRLLAEGNIKTVSRVKSSPASQEQLEFFLERYLEYYLEKRFKVKNTMKVLKKRMIL